MEADCTRPRAGFRLMAVFHLADFPLPLEQRLPLGVGISCACILFFCLLCYFSIIK